MRVVWICQSSWDILMCAYWNIATLVSLKKINKNYNKYKNIDSCVSSVSKIFNFFF